MALNWGLTWGKKVLGKSFGGKSGGKFGGKSGGKPQTLTSPFFPPKNYGAMQTLPRKIIET